MRWFFILQPWEQAIRVRAGKRIKKFTGGIHFKIPYLDYVFSQNQRMRLSPVPSQVLTTLDGKTITLAGSIRYSVADVEPLFTKLHMAEETIAQEAQLILAEYVPTVEFSECEPAHLRELVNQDLDLEKFGLADVEFVLTDYAVVKTYRLITGEMDTWTQHALTTDEADE